MGREKAQTDDVARLLGLKKGSLRFVPHGTTVKAHVVLRRVEPSSDDSEDEEDSASKHSAVYYSLFAAKRIEVKPGKEILLSISTSGHLKDQALLITGEIASEDDESDLEESETTQVAEEDELGEAGIMPPKMRKSDWFRTDDVTALPFHPGALPIYTSVGVQAEPPRLAASVQVDPPPPPPRQSASVQATATQSSISVQAVPPQSSVSIQAMAPQQSVSIQVIPPQNSISIQAFPSQSVASVQVAPSQSSEGVQVAPPQISEGVQVVPPQSSAGVQVAPPQTSVSVEAIPPAPPARLSHSIQTEPSPPPPARISISTQADPPVPSPKPLRSKSVGVSTTPLIILPDFNQPIPRVEIDGSTVGTVEKAVSSTATSTETKSAGNLLAPPQSRRVRSLSPMEIESDAENDYEPHVRQMREVCVKRESPTPVGAFPTPPPSHYGGSFNEIELAQSSAADDCVSQAPPRDVAVKRESLSPRMPVARRQLSENAVASGSNVTLDHAPPDAPSSVRTSPVGEDPAPHTSRSRSLPLDELALSTVIATNLYAATAEESRALSTGEEVIAKVDAVVAPPSAVSADSSSKEVTPLCARDMSSPHTISPPSLPPPPPKLPLPPVPEPAIYTRARDTLFSSNSTPQPITPHPPPDPKSLVYIPTGPSSNPLSIRPSMPAAMRGLINASARIPTGPAALVSTRSATKKGKPLVVGANWPPPKGVSNSNAANGAASRSSTHESISPQRTTRSSRDKPPHLISPPPPPELTAEVSPPVPSPQVDESAKEAQTHEPTEPARSEPDATGNAKGKASTKWMPIAGASSQRSVVQSSSDPSPPSQEPAPDPSPPPEPEPETAPPSAPAPAKKKRGGKAKNRGGTKKKAAAANAAKQPPEAPEPPEAPPPAPPPQPPAVAEPPPTPASTISTSSLPDLPFPASQSVPLQVAFPTSVVTTHFPAIPTSVSSSFPPPPFSFYNPPAQTTLFYPPPQPTGAAPAVPSEVLHANGNGSVSTPASSSHRPTIKIPTTLPAAPIPPPPQSIGPTTSHTIQTDPSRQTHASIAHPETPKSSSGPKYHPLPPKPVVPAEQLQRAVPRGVKRAASALLPISPVVLSTPDSPTSTKTDMRPKPLYSLKVKGDTAVKEIVLCRTGEHFAVSCVDRTVRIFNNLTRTELAMLQHNAPVISVRWLADNNGILSLGESGVVSKWTRIGPNRWHWAKELDLNEGRPMDGTPVCIAHVQDRISVATPKGIRIWLWNKGSWHEQRAILRQHTTTIRFIEDGEALLGATTDGVLWYCQVPNGTLRVISLLGTALRTLDVDPRGFALVTRPGDTAFLINIHNTDQKAKADVKFIERRDSSTAGAIFATNGRCVVYGVVDRSLQVWDRYTGDRFPTSEMDHGEDADVRAIVSCDNHPANTPHLLTGTLNGRICWWPMPSPPPVEAPRKRAKVI
ncbi:hypothetical protein PUNSTDRAFT_144401 [Punctularia strigosozonata HHB-11173 SS5]|uniref:uncharacterized protein n=1 Tax=Punctularia strigosozonata (strain HHB-11173) TaxID=741275 RepID=UPI000441649A|nr:uncharacterized protein PUNSTDRAFT_144401 [Punctularia strigosozonata HHB-11173 SS5]EIN07911.1 hypothetical protein PUNSTDRAFT_144401 [Punctularia strigosozonata HHB-11173 SS5]